MTYKEVKCPYCKNDLQVPDKLDQCICMYCGKKINLNCLEGKEENLLEYEKECEYSMIEGPNILLKHLDLMKYFKAKLYEEAFAKYKNDCEKTIMTLDKACARVAYVDTNALNKKEYVLSSQEELLKVWVHHVIDTIKESYRSATKLEECRLILALYTIPMIRELKLEISEELADLFVSEWGEQFPKQKFSKADYTEIAEGFYKRKLCFITTAVCEAHNKPDDCYELTKFREFRDGYMLKSTEGKAAIEKYYSIAPSIVNVINVLEEREQIYDEIWTGYLQPCLTYIENGNFVECNTLYTSMVTKLYGKYILFN